MADCSSSSEDVRFLDRPLKDGERVVAPTRRPDGSMRKAIRIRAGYTPQEEVAIYQSRGALFRKGLPQVPPGYDPVDDVNQKPKTKAAKKNEKRKEKKHQRQVEDQVAAGSTLSIHQVVSHCGEPSQSSTCELQPPVRDNSEIVVQEMSSLTLSAGTSAQTSPQVSQEGSRIELDKRIRALRKKIRLMTESLQISSVSNKGNPEQNEKLARLDIWHKELKELEALKGLS